MTYTAQLTPSPRVSPGLIDAYTDMLGGDYVQANVAGNQSALNFNLAQAQFPVVAGGPTGKQVVIPAAWNGGNVTWIRGMYALSATPRYADFMADFNAGDTTNYADFTQAATNNYSGGVLSTSVPILAAVALGTLLQGYFSYRTNVQTAKGQAMSGWPMLHIDPYQGTANDGDDYMMHSLYHAFRVTGDGKYKALADKIGNALLAAGRWSSNLITFQLPFDEERGNYGVYWYNAPATPFFINVVKSPDLTPTNALYINTTVTAGNYAGVGIWPTFQVSAQSQFNSFDFNIWGDGSTRNLLLTTSITAGTLSAMIPLMPAAGGKWYSFSIKPSQFWLTGNVVYDAQHVDYAYATPYGSNSYAINSVADTVNGYIIREFDWNFVGNGAGYAGYVFGPAPVSSAGTTAFKFDFYTATAGTFTISAVDNTNTKYSVNLAMAAGWNTGQSIAWTTFNAGFVHPATQFQIDVPTAMQTGAIRLNNCRYDAVVTMAASTYTAINGFQFAFPSNPGGPYAVYFNKWFVNQNMIDGPATDPTRYAGIPRWTYKWQGDGSAAAPVGYGSWRGPSAAGYLWLGGWKSSGIANPDNNKVIATAMLDFMQDSQNAYAAQFPAQTKGPFINLYGRPSWEAISTPGYVGGALQTGVTGQWYFSSTDDWYGYNYRALLSVAQYYYLTQSPQAKAILDNWMAWINVKILPDGLYWKAPSDFYSNGTLGYTYKPVYSFATIAAACMLKYFVDGDAIAQTWYRRLLDTLYYNNRLTSTGGLAGIYPTAEGTGYTTATVNFTVNVGAVAPVATAFIAGGKVTHYVVTSAGSGITSISCAITGDGAGAVGNPYLTDALVGAFSTEHTGWEAAEIYNAFALLINGPPPGGYANFTLSAGPHDLDAFTGLYAFYARNTSNSKPAMRNTALIPFHEFDFGSWHWGAAIENPMISDTGVKGAMWTETIAPTLYMAVEYYRYSSDATWLTQLYNLLLEFTGAAPPPSNFFVPNSVSKESQIWEGEVHFMGKKRR